MKLNVFIAKSGVLSRRKAADLIKDGKVTVNGKVSREPWLEVKHTDRVSVNRKTLNVEGNVYLVFNKPKGVTTTLEDRFAQKKIIDYIPKAMGRVYPVGRLDKLSRGLIILTNDGDLCYRLTHPKFEIEKEYMVLVNGEIGKDIIHKIKCGVWDKGDILRVKSVSIEDSGVAESRVRVIASEGKKRHIRRLFESLGFSVLDLARVRIGGLKLGKLKEGEFKVVDREAIYELTIGPGRTGAAG